ncbi:hypothetical protein PUN28_002845 [Cardiocondyla obscurior]|uniref:Uncharacterized protein n=1 Tax=Cardiocondyla obscurior TaxID=286306 RepID=A0AAW2GWA8_9HYME
MNGTPKVTNAFHRSFRHLYYEYAVKEDRSANNVRSLSANRGAFQRAVTSYGTLASAAFDLSLHWNLSSDQRNRENTL